MGSTYFTTRRKNAKRFFINRGNIFVLQICSCQVEKFVAKVKAEKERARKALEMEARREQGAVSSTFFNFPLSLKIYLFNFTFL